MSRNFSPPPPPPRLRDPFDDWDSAFVDTQSSQPQEKDTKTRRFLETVRNVLRSEEPYVPIFNGERYPFESYDEYDLRRRRYYEALAEQERHRSTKKRRRSIAGIVGATLTIGSIAAVAKNMIDPEERVLAEEHTEQVSETTIDKVDAYETFMSSEPVTLRLVHDSPTTETLPNLFPETIPDPANLNSECRTSDVRLPVIANYQELQGVSGVDFALETDEFARFSKAIEAAKSTLEVEQILKDVFTPYGLAVSIGKDPLYEADNIQQNLTLDEIKHGAIQNIRALAYVPADLITSINLDGILFTSDDMMAGTNDISGYYFLSSNRGRGQIAVELQNASPITLIHEFGHSLNAALCEEIFSGDRTLSDAYTLASTMLEQDESFTNLKQKYDAFAGGDKDAITLAEYNQYQLLVEIHGFPTDYSLTNESEMFAEALSFLIMSGYEPYSETDSSASRARAIVLEATIERLQAGLPNVDVSAWIQYMSTYGRIGAGPDRIAPSEVIQQRRSLLDASLYEDPRIARDSILLDETRVYDSPLQERPAILVTDGGVSQYVYAHFDQSTGEVMIFLQETQGELPDGARQAAIAYLHSIMPNVSVNEVRAFGGVIFTVQT